MTDNPDRGKVAQTVSHFHGDHGGFTLTTFKHNGDVHNIWKPLQFSMWLSPDDSGAILFKDAKGEDFIDAVGEYAQAILNAVHAGEAKTFFLDGRIADCNGKIIKEAD